MASSAPFDPANIQGDVLAGFNKKSQLFIFFQIDDDVKTFRRQLALLLPLITNSNQVGEQRAKIAASKQEAAQNGTAAPLLPISGVNIAFSAFGLKKLGITDEIGDQAFDDGQLKDAQNLGDPGTLSADGKTFTPSGWVPAFKNGVDGVLVIAGDSHVTLQATRAAIALIFHIGAAHATMHEVLTLTGDVRPGAEKGHEHFGFLDGISQPAVQGFDNKPNPGQETVRPGIMLLGREGDAPTLNGQPVTRPAWALDGTFLAFRYLFQLVPEFDRFLEANPIKSTGLSPKEGSELLGARLMGRWKSGAPIDITPLQDDPALGADKTRNNDFRYAFGDDFTSQDRCPFAAHTRKTNPRADLENIPGRPPNPQANEIRRIIRRGIQFGPEVTPEEAQSGKTKFGRGLLFTAYQSNIVNGFQFIQHSWANNTGFPIQKPVTPGFDPIIGQTSEQTIRSLSGTDPSNQGATLSLSAEWVIPKGGEYFFVPSIPALRSRFALLPGQAA